MFVRKRNAKPKIAKKKNQQKDKEETIQTLRYDEFRVYLQM
jgi:hypothetical protein